MEEEDEFEPFLTFKKCGSGHVCIWIALSMLVPIGVTFLTLGIIGSDIGLLVAGVSVLLLSIIAMTLYCYLYRLIQIGYRNTQNENFEKYIMIKTTKCILCPSCCVEYDKPPGAGSKTDHKITFNVKQPQQNDGIIDTLCCDEDDTIGCELYLNVGTSLEICLDDNAGDQQGGNKTVQVLEQKMREAIQSNTTYVYKK
eukprot:149566_1